MTNPADSIHPFEKAGLGRAPFTWLGVFEDIGPHRRMLEDGVELLVGAPGQPMGTCAYCGQGIAECHSVRSADGREFTVGCECVNKTSHEGSQLWTQAKKAHRARVNARSRARSKAKAQDSKSRLAALMADPELQEALKSQPSRHDWKAAQGGTAWDDAVWMADNCGHAGRVRQIKYLESIKS